MTKSEPAAGATPAGTPAKSATPTAAVTPTAQPQPAAALAGQQPPAAVLPKVTPKDGQVIAAILKDMGITEYEPRVVHQLLEFSYRYVTTVLEDAQVFSAYSKKKNLDLEDVKLSVQMQTDRMFTTPPPRELVAEIARTKNCVALPPIKSHAGPRLPPDRYSLISCNFKMKATEKLTVAPSTPATANVTLPFRTVTPTSILTKPQTITLQQRMIGNRLTLAAPVAGEVITNTATKRKIDEI